MTTHKTSTPTATTTVANLHSLPLADASHAERPLSVVSESHVLAEGNCGYRGQSLLDVHACEKNAGSKSNQKSKFCIDRND